MNANVRICLKKFVMAVVCLIALDAVIGGCSRLVFLQQRSGKFYRIRNAMQSANARLFVFGSSHAASHYVPDVLETELGVSSYNAGVLGQQILFHRTLESIVLQRTTPDVIILDVDPGTLYEARESYDRLAELKPFYFLYPEIIGPVLDYRSRMERVFLLSKLYQYNSTFVHVVRYAVSPQPDWNGYRPDYGVMRALTADEERAEIAARLAYRANRELDPVMIGAMEQFALEAMRRNVEVFYVVSPGAVPDELLDNASFRTIEAMADRLGVPLLNFRNHPQFVRRYAQFADAGHLNDAGARRYSRLVAESIRNRTGARKARGDQRPIRRHGDGNRP